MKKEEKKKIGDLITGRELVLLSQASQEYDVVDMSAENATYLIDTKVKEEKEAISKLKNQVTVREENVKSLEKIKKKINQ